MTTTALAKPPELSLRWTPVWQRNLLVWRKLAIASVLGNIADPLLYMLALGYGIGAFVPQMDGMPYIAFIGTGMVCQSAMFTASFEGMYSAFSRMFVQRTWDAIINAPVSLDDVVFAEWIWCGTKAVMSTTAILAVISLLGYVHTWHAVWILPLGFLIGLAFGSFGLIMTALAGGYDFFTYFFTLVLTPMLLLSGVYFPVAQMPEALQAVASLLPLKHAIDIARPLLAGRMPPDLVVHLAVILVYACAGFYIALVLTRRRLLK
ncbi:MAG TPA: ABC transporter permease [Casimicrobiaceae bacterium]|nr:ABC transporter permease [Casimicrobiaceae bacterium]